MTYTPDSLRALAQDIVNVALRDVWDTPFARDRAVADLRDRSLNAAGAWEADKARIKALEKALTWIASNDPKGDGDIYWYGERCGIVARAALAAGEGT